jgi:uncharacterized integral membrane protein
VGLYAHRELIFAAQLLTVVARVIAQAFRHSRSRCITPAEWISEPGGGLLEASSSVKLRPMHTTTKIKLILGGLLLVLGIIFAVQNSTVVEVKFLVWSLKVSQALVIFLTGAAGIIAGFFIGTAFKITRQN